MNRYEYTDNPIEDILEDFRDGFAHEGSWTKKLFMRPCILLISIVFGCLAAVVSGYASAWCVGTCIQYLPSMRNLPLIPVCLFLFLPLGVALVGFSTVRQQAYMVLRRRAGDPCDDRVIIPVRILSESCA